MTGAPHLELGSAGEEAALAAYRARGFELVARNWRCSLGEIDLVLRQEGLVVVCEVKTRRGFNLGGPFEAVDARKQTIAASPCPSSKRQIPSLSRACASVGRPTKELRR